MAIDGAQYVGDSREKQQNCIEAKDEDLTRYEMGGKRRPRNTRVLNCSEGSAEASCHISRLHGWSLGKDGKLGSDVSCLSVLQWGPSSNEVTASRERCLTTDILIPR